jgi:hypothetical protein
MVGKYLSCLVCIGTSRRILLHAGSFAADLLVVVCGCGGHINRSRLHVEADSVLTLSEHRAGRGLKDKYGFDKSFVRGVCVWVSSLLRI